MSVELRVRAVSSSVLSFFCSRASAYLVGSNCSFFQINIIRTILTFLSDVSIEKHELLELRGSAFDADGT